MASRQATTTRLRAADFQGNRISFPVESVLGIGQGTGELIIDASAGYLLVTPTNTSPQSQQTIPYVLQPNGTHLAHAVITVLRTGSLSTNGTVTLRNPLGETTVLPIDADTDTGLLANLPVLTLSTETLTFAKTAVGEAEYALVKVNQQGANTLVTLTSDDPAHFLLATGVEELRFTSTVSFVPLPTGTFVHVRYAPDRSGQHTARLFVETSFDTKTVLLRGRAAGLLSALPQRSPKAKRVSKAIKPEPSPGGGRWIPISVVLLLGGLAWAGYFYRCQFAPGLCRNEPLTRPVSRPDELPGGTAPAQPVEKPLTATGKQNDDDTEPAADETTRSTSNRKKARKQTTRETEPKAAKQSKPDPESEPQERPERGTTRSSDTPRRIQSDPVEPAPRKRKAAAPSTAPNPTGESDLEKALNKKSDKPI